MLMEGQGFTAEEFAKLNQDEDNSNALVKTEPVTKQSACGAVEGSTAAQELTAQARALRDVVNTLEMMVETRPPAIAASPHGRPQDTPHRP